LQHGGDVEELAGEVLVEEENVHGSADIANQIFRQP
jgi:hypothetical protein